MTALPGKILIIDKDPVVAQQVSTHLKSKGYFIADAKDGPEGARKASLFTPDLILIDTITASKDEIKNIWQISPAAVILLTGRDEDAYKTGETDSRTFIYIAKPIKPEALAYKIETALRPFGNEDKDELKHVHDDLEINLTNFTVHYKGTKIPFAKKEFELLSLLASRPGRVFLRQDILLRVWGGDVHIGLRTIDVHVRKIRKKLGSDMIKTVKRVGYKLHTLNTNP